MGKLPDIGTRMKRYESSFRPTMPPKSIVVVRVDGRAFHTFTRGLEKPFDNRFREAMLQTAQALCKAMPNAKLAYTQSDEISILLWDNDSVETQPWFDNDLSKLVSLSASLATVHFNRVIPADWASKLPHFDARAFILPNPEEAVNYLLWRQQDATRNSIQMAARSLFSQKEVQGKNVSELMDMMFLQKGVNWDSYPTMNKRGACVVYQPGESAMERIQTALVGATAIPPRRGAWVVDYETPLFSKDRAYVTERLKPREKGKTVVGYILRTG